MMKIKVSSSFEELMKRVDCSVILREAWLDKIRQDFDQDTILQTPHKDVKISANGIWEEDTNILKLLITIPESNIAKSNDEGNPDAFVTEEYGAIYFFSGNEPAFVIYDETGANLDLSLGKNLIDLEFPEDWKGRIELVDTSEDTLFLETFGQHPGKNIYITGNEDALVSKETYYSYWRLEVARDYNTTDLPLLDENGKLVVENYRYRTYSNLRIDTPGLTRTTTPHTRYGLSNNGGTVPIIGTADFIEYRVFGDSIEEVLRGRTTIDSIPSSQIIYISGHDDNGILVDEVHNIFTINNYSSMIDYIRKEDPSSYGADGLFSLRVSYYDVKEQRPVVLNSDNQIRLVRRERSNNWFILRSTTHYIEETEEYGDVPVFLFPFNTLGTEGFTIRTRFLEPIQNINQLQITFEDPILNDLFTVTPVLEPFVDTDGAYYVDIVVTLKAITENEDPIKWAPIINDISTLVLAKISYNEYFEVFYMVQCPKIEDSLKLVDNNGDRVDRVVLNYGTGSNKIVYVVADEETGDLGERDSWRVMAFPDGMTFNQRYGVLSGRVDFNPGNTLQVIYDANSPTAQDIAPEQDIIVARLKGAAVTEDLETTTNWRLMVDIAQIHVGFMKYGRNILVYPSVSSVNIRGVGLYEFSLRSDCRFTLTTEDSRYIFREQGGTRALPTLESPSYNDPRYARIGDGYFNYWVQVIESQATEPITLSPIKIIAQEGERSLEVTVNVNQSLVPSDIYKLKQDSSPYSTGEWNVAYGLESNNRNAEIPYSDTSWIKYGRSGTIDSYSTTRTYSKGELVKYYIDNPGAPLYNVSTTYSEDNIVKYSGYWWRSLSSNNTGHTPEESSEYWENVTQYFISKSNRNRDYTPQQGDLSSWWYEIPSVRDYYELDQRPVTNIASSDFYEGYTRYKIGDIVRKNNYYTWVNSYIYDINTKVQTSDGRCWVSLVSHNQGHDPATSEDYWREAGIDDFEYYIARKTMYRQGATLMYNISKLGTSSSSIWWTQLSSSSVYGDFIGLPRNYRFIVVREDDTPFLYMKMTASVSNPGNYVNDIVGLRRAILAEQDNEDAIFILDHPELYRSGTSLKIIPANSRDDSSGLGQIRDIYLYLSRDSSWVIMDNIEALMRTLGVSYNDSYFSGSSTRAYTRVDYKIRQKYSDLIPSSGERQVFIVSEYTGHTTLENLARYCGYSSTKKLLPHYTSLTLLPTLDTLARTTDSKFIRTYCKIPDAGIMRTAKLTLTWDGNNLGPVYKGQYSGSETYSVGDIVYYIITGTEKMYYKAKSGASGNNPSTDDGTYWDCLTWTELVGIDTLENSIQYVKTAMNLRSTEEIKFLGHYTVGNLYNVTRTYLGREPKPGNIIRIGSTFYYCGVLWELGDEGVEDLVLSELSDQTKLPAIENGYTNVLCRINLDYFYCKSEYVFNNVKVNQYIFVPRSSGTVAQLRFFSRKTPGENLQVPPSNSMFSLYGNLTISSQSTPEFGDNDSTNDHYISHSIELGYTPGTNEIITGQRTEENINNILTL